MAEAAENDEWWRRAVIYEIAPISFQDSNGDGRGDLAGLLSRLDYLAWLGVDAVWLTPIYKSPFRDLGYDVSDYCAIDKVVGSLQDFEGLISKLHESNIRIILDLVPNHTANDHSWFVESRSSRVNSNDDWYIWADAAENGGPPNNWRSRFGGTAWEWCETRQQYYYHSFLIEQPDLNWRNRKLRAAFADVMRFWLDRGVDGFRVDASAVLIKDELLRDNPPNLKVGEDRPPPQRDMPVFTDDRPEAMHCLEYIRQVLDEYSGRLLCGEVQGKSDRIGHFYGTDKPRLHLPLNFALLDSEWNAISLQATIDAYYNALPERAWPVWVIGGHDKQRVASKIGQEQARVLAMLLLTLRGTPFFYMGDEIGRERVPLRPDCVRDPFEKLVPGYDLCRDPERAPMRWNASPKGGFTTGEPWLPLETSGQLNIEQQQRDKGSLLHLYRRLMALRRDQPCLVQGEYQPIRARNDVLSYRRVLGDKEIAIALNISGEPRRWQWQGRGKLLISTRLDRPLHAIEGPVQLLANEGFVVELKAAPLTD